METGDKEQQGKLKPDHVDSANALRNDQDIKSDEDTHEAEAGNRGEPEAEKDMLSGPAVDLVAQPKNED